MVVTDGRLTIDVPFEEGDTVLNALQRVIKISAPCQGRGVCGRCLIEVEQPDGSLKKELACYLQARYMIIHLPFIHTKKENDS